MTPSILLDRQAEHDEQHLLLADWGLEDCENLFHLCKQTLGFTKLEETPHADLCDFLTNAGKYAGRLHNKWKLILVPRGTYKTTIGAIGLPIWHILRNSNVRILLDGETHEKSKETLRAVRGIVTTNPRFQAIHGQLYDPQTPEARAFAEKNGGNLLWNEERIIVGTRTDFARKEPTIDTGGIDVVRTGMHYDLCIGDDYHSKKNVTNREQIEKVIQHIRLMTMILDPDTNYYIFGTRWDDKDAYNWIIRDIEGLKIVEPGVYAGKQFDVMHYPWRWERQGTKRYFAPAIWNEDTFAKVRRVMTSYEISCQLENDPVDEATAVFKKSWLKYVKASSLPKMDMVRFTAIDPAASVEAKRDYSAFVTVGYDSKLNRYLLDAHFGRWEAADLVEQTFQVYETYKPLQIGFEAVSGFKAFKALFDETMRRRKKFLPMFFTDRTPEAAKPTRIRSLEAMFREGYFHIVEGCRGLDEFLEEFQRWPRSRHDDLLDALAAVEAMKWFPGESVDRTMEREYVPMDSITGYVICLPSLLMIPRWLLPAPNAMLICVSGMLSMLAIIRLMSNSGARNTIGGAMRYGRAVVTRYLKSIVRSFSMPWQIGMGGDVGSVGAN